MIGEIIKTSNCGCKILNVRSTDLIVKEQPPKTFIVHSCENVKVYQIKGSMKRFYEFKTKKV